MLKPNANHPTSKQNEKNENVDLNPNPVGILTNVPEAKLIEPKFNENSESNALFINQPISKDIANNKNGALNQNSVGIIARQMKNISHNAAAKLNVLDSKLIESKLNDTSKSKVFSRNRPTSTDIKNIEI